MSRDSTIKAVAGALQPKALDLTQFARARSASSERSMKLRSEDAAGALAFAALDREIRGETERGDPLPGLLLELKYAQKRSKETFSRAHRLLARRHGGLYRPRSQTVSAIAVVALYEWLHDVCPKCRGTRAGALRPRPCPDCRTSALMGCPKCGGLGRVFRRPDEAKGMKCGRCGNSGRLAFLRKKRWLLVSGQLQSGHQLQMDAFFAYWLPLYWTFLEVLQRVDRNIVAGLDIRLIANENRPIGPEPRDDNEGAEQATDERDENPASPYEPKSRTGVAVPRIPEEPAT